MSENDIFKNHHLHPHQTTSISSLQEPDVPLSTTFGKRVEKNLLHGDHLKTIELRSSSEVVILNQGAPDGSRLLLPPISTAGDGSTTDKNQKALKAAFLFDQAQEEENELKMVQKGPRKIEK